MFPVVLNYIKQNGGSEEQARDIFQDAMVVFYRKLQDDTFELTCKIQTFLYSVSRNLWLNELKSRIVIAPQEEIKDSSEEDIEVEDNDVRGRVAILNASLQNLGEPCATILKYYYVENLSMQEISKRMSYTNAENAKNQKYKCLVRLKKLFFKNASDLISLEN
jgi:RNA polymerase sigma factor (sigma-70 family)